MFKKFAAMFTYMVAFLGMSGNEQALIKDGELQLTDKQKEDLQKALGAKVKLEDVVTAMNAELATINKIDTDANDQQLVDLRAKAFEMLKEHEFTDAEAKKLIDNPGAAEGKTEKQLLAGLVTAMDEQKALAKEQDKKIAKLLGSAEGDSPLEIIQNTVNTAMKHSKTHLFSSGKQYDAIEGRNWNERAAGIHDKPTDWASEGKTEISKLKGDIDLYYRENPTVIQSLHRDLMGLPANWKIRTKVDDRVADGSIVTAEISQARKLPWLPKNNQAIEPEEGKIFPVHIDIEFAGYRLQEIETSWLNYMNNEGSQPYKMTFVRFLLLELDKQARLEDRIVVINGVYVKTPENATIPGMAIHRGDGLLIQLWRALFITKKFVTPIGLGTPDENNIVDYVKSFIEKNLLEELKSVQGLVLYMSPTMLRWHIERKRFLFNLTTDWSDNKAVMIENYENITIQPLRDLEGTKFMFMTFTDNIEILENIPGEKSMYHFDSLKRMLFIWADYKLGARFKHIGRKLKQGDPLSFKKQTVWTNGLSPFKSDFYVRLYDYGTGEINIDQYYSNITITEDYATSIVDIKGAYEGQIIRVRGNTAVGAGVKVVDDGNITLASNADFLLNTGGTLTLRAAANGDLTEVKRTTTPEVLPSTDVNYTGTTLDANAGNVFKYTGTGAKTLTAIANGVEGQQIVINGGAGGAVTVADVVGNIEVVTSAVLANGADNVTLTLIDGVWTEVARTIA